MSQALFWFRVAVLFLWRSVRVTLVLALMIFTAVIALVFGHGGQRCHDSLRFY